jgi:hypothetical protein
MQASGPGVQEAAPRSGADSEGPSLRDPTLDIRPSASIRVGGLDRYAKEYARMEGG